MNGRRKQTIKVQAVTQPTTENGVSSLSNSLLDSQAKTNIESPIADIDQRSIFIQTLQAVECSPREAAETIADPFFSGNINDPKWLKRVLTRDAAGFLPPRGQRLMFSFWCITRGLPFDEEDLPPVEFDADEENNQSGENLKSEISAPPFDPGLGWRIEKDRRGHWVSVPIGPLTYEEAFRYAQQREFISRYGGRIWR